MMDIRDNRIIPFLNDYKLNIISVAEIADDDFDKFNTVLGKVLKIVKHQKEDADKLIEELGHTRIDPDAAFFLKKAANLDIEIEVKDGGRKSSGDDCYAPTVAERRLICANLLKEDIKKKKLKVPLKVCVLWGHQIMTLSQRLLRLLMLPKNML